MNQHFSNILKENASFVWLNGNNHTDGLMAIGVEDELLVSSEINAFNHLESFLMTHKNKYIFGYLTYDLKNDIEKLVSTNRDQLKFPSLYFFVPKTVLRVNKTSKEVSLIFGNTNELEQFQSLVQDTLTNNEIKNGCANKIKLVSSLTKEVYIDKISKIKEHIQHGEVYELNFCYDFYAQNVEINPLEVYQAINQKSRASFSVFAKFNDHYVMGASPERFFKKEKNRVFSQPIKGTIRRGVDVEEDERLKEVLRHDPKERRENIMIVDLVRNDLSKIAAKGSVKVDELCEIYTFDTLHQMISTVSCELINSIDIIDVFKALFPMGSMTGAPKIRAMELIEQFEESKRGLYSGTIGYIAPNSDADFNVVIRSLLYNAIEKSCSYSVGSAITNASEPEKEFDETILKAQLVLQLFSENN